MTSDGTKNSKIAQDLVNNCGIFIFLILDETFAFFLKITKILTSYFELWRTSSRNVLSWRTYLRKEFVLDEMFSLFFINEAFLHLSHWKNWVQRIKAVVKLTVCLLAYTIALDLRRIRDDSVIRFSIQTQCDSVRYWSLFNLRKICIDALESNILELFH